MSNTGKRPELEWLAKAVAGTCSGVLSTALCSPLDVAKVRPMLPTPTFDRVHMHAFCVQHLLARFSTAACI